MSTESIASTPPTAAANASCASCGSLLAEDQRYCLRCGERTAPPRSVLLGGPPSQPAAVQPSAPLVPLGFPPPGTARDGQDRRGNAVTIIAGRRRAAARASIGAGETAPPRRGAAQATAVASWS
ncbi:MAG TPA: hypothetical protein VG188_05895 [Solirubrobacteraceae bacterium]|nr:hypothetical protein [Solirubrobacteraceae bacterium]